MATVRREKKSVLEWIIGYIVRTVDCDRWGVIRALELASENPWGEHIHSHRLVET